MSQLTSMTFLITKEKKVVLWHVQTVTHYMASETSKFLQIFAALVDALDNKSAVHTYNSHGT